NRASRKSTAPFPPTNSAAHWNSPAPLASGSSTPAGAVSSRTAHPCGFRACAIITRHASTCSDFCHSEQSQGISDLTTDPVVAFVSPASAWPIFFLAVLVLPQRGQNFPNGQEFLWRDRGFLWVNQRGGRPGCRSFCRRRRG